MICILLCCGCKARYEVKFNNNIISDKLSVTYSKDDEVIRSFAPDPLFALDNIQYDVNINNTNNYINSNYTYNFDVDNYSKAFVPNSCFSSFNFIKDEDKYYFIADGEFLCRHIANRYFDSLDIVISTNHPVIQSNADEIKNGKYVWHVDSSDENFSLRFVVSEKTKSSNFKNYFWGIISVVGVGVILVVKKNSKRDE